MDLGGYSIASLLLIRLFRNLSFKLCRVEKNIEAWHRLTENVKDILVKVDYLPHQFEFLIREFKEDL